MKGFAALLAAGVVQGFLEWLPVSSSGQVDLLLRAAGYGGVEEAALALHLGTGVAALVRYRGLVLRGLRGGGVELYALIVPLLVGAPVAYLLLGLARMIVLDVNAVIGLLLVVTGLVLLYRPSGGIGRDPSLLDLAVIGVLQGVAVLPGLSRSAVVTAYLLYRVRDPLTAVVYAFYTGVTAQLAAGLYGLALIVWRDPWVLAAVALSGVAGYAAIRLVEGLASLLRRRLAPFLLAYGVLVVALDISSRLAGG